MQFRSPTDTCYVAGAAYNDFSVHIPRLDKLVSQKIKLLPARRRPKFIKAIQGHDREIDQFCLSMQTATVNLAQQQRNLAQTFGELIDEVLRAQTADESDNDSPDDDGGNDPEQHSEPELQGSIQEDDEDDDSIPEQDDEDDAQSDSLNGTDSPAPAVSPTGLPFFLFPQPIVSFTKFFIPYLLSIYNVRAHYTGFGHYYLFGCLVTSHFYTTD